MGPNQALGAETGLTSYQLSRATLQARSYLGEQSAYAVHGDLFQVFDHHIGAGGTESGLAVMAHEVDGDAFHAAGLSGLDAGHSVFNHDAIAWWDFQSLGGHQEHQENGVSALGFFHRNKNLKKRAEVGHF